MTKRDLFSNPRIFVAYWAENNPKRTAADLATFQLDYAEELQKFNLSRLMAGEKTIQKPIAPRTLEYAFEEYWYSIPEKFRAVAAQAMPCKTEDLNPLRTWLHAVTGQVLETDLQVMAHWIWLVKRNALGQEVVHHIVPIVIGKDQGSGKSVAVTRLISPLHRELISKFDIPQLVDERSYRLFTTKLIGNLDEMAGAAKVDVALFKGNVTSSYITYRPMRSNLIVQLRNYCSFIGSSNNTIYEMIKDTTGTRRFWAIQAQHPIPRDAINNIDYTALWAGIDEQRERGYIETVIDQLTIKQAENTLQDEVMLFFEDNGVKAPIKDAVVVNGKLLFQEYLFYARNSGLRFTVSPQVFYKKLKELGLISQKRPDANNSLTYFFTVDANCAVAGTTGGKSAN